jgi:hypothetical protein
VDPSLSLLSKLEETRDVNFSTYSRLNTKVSVKDCKKGVWVVVIVFNLIFN